MKVLLCHPGASWSTADVYDGLIYGLKHHGVQTVEYRLDGRIRRADKWLKSAWRDARKQNPSLDEVTTDDIFYEAGTGLLAMALRQQVDVVLVVSAMFLHPDIIICLKRAGLRVVVLFTESPYNEAQELRVAGLVDGCWTNERSAVEAFRKVNPNSGYLPHGWHPEKHRAWLHPEDANVPSHDVVFVGTAFQERVEWLSAIDWTGIDLGLYGNWRGLTRHRLRQFVRNEWPISNDAAAALYRRAGIGLNLYRTSREFPQKDGTRITYAESLNPRAYELAACGAFHLSSDRAEVAEVFGNRVPTFRHPTEASALIRTWLADDDGRARVASELPACVAEMSWVARAAQVIGDIQRLLRASAA
jgi:spore maturation protein CgeB